VETVWILGDQLTTSGTALAGRRPGEVRVLMIESEAKLAGRPRHRQRLHFVLASMRRFAAARRREGYEVDYRTAPSLHAGVEGHRREHAPAAIRVMEPMSWTLNEKLPDLGVTVTPSNQFLCHKDAFAAWAAGRATLRMEDFYRVQRRRHGYLMDGDDPAGGEWNYDRFNREPPPRDGRPWPRRPRSRLDALDRKILEELPPAAYGAPPDGTWATTRRGALARLRFFVDHVLPIFGPHEDAMLTDEWAMAHSLLSPYLNVGLLHPGEVCDAVETAYRRGTVPLASAEGMIRQVLGWREYVWGVYWLWMPEYRSLNALDARRPLPPAFRDGRRTEMRCVSSALEGVERRAYAHHIQRLMVLANLGLLAGTRPAELVEWMWSSFVDGAEWVMLPNVVGMGLYADGGMMSSKPYAAGGNYINRMSDSCGSCRFDPRRRTGTGACPFTTLYWAFLDRHRDRLASNHRMARQLAALGRLDDIVQVRARAADVLSRLEAGTL
jgi:deoxyribodipyrimidine photolyase-related protein